MRVTPITRGDTLPPGEGDGHSANPRTFGVVLLQNRLAAGLSQEELAERAGLSRGGVSDLWYVRRGADPAGW